MTILQWGTEEQKQKYFSSDAKGEKIGAFGLTEPGAGSDVANIQTTGSKRWRLLYFKRSKNMDLFM